MGRKTKGRGKGISKDIVTGTWETVGSSWVSNGAPVESGGLLTKSVVTRGNTPYKTYFSLITGTFDNSQRSAKTLAYADSNQNGTLDSDDLALGEAVTKAYADNAGGFSGTFIGSLKSNVVYSLINGKRAGETTYNSSTWGSGSSRPTSQGTTTPPSTGQSGQQGGKQDQGSTASDPITGQLLTFSDLGTIESDKIYGKETRWTSEDRLRGPGLYGNLNFTKQELDSLTTFQVEFEFNNQFIAVTTQVRGDTRGVYGISSTLGSDWTARWVLAGSFEYSNGSLSAAAIRSGGYQLISQSKIYSSGNAVDSNTADSGFETIQDPSTWANIRSPLSSGRSSFGTPKGLGLTANFYPISSRPDPENDLRLQNWLREFGGGQFFYNGWETNPFNSNLI
jgi:hypothetical protein